MLSSEGFSLFILFDNNLQLRNSMLDSVVCGGRCAEEVNLYKKNKLLWTVIQWHTWKAPFACQTCPLHFYSAVWLVPVEGWKQTENEKFYKVSVWQIFLIICYLWKSGIVLWALQPPEKLPKLR